VNTDITDITNETEQGWFVQLRGLPGWLPAAILPTLAVFAVRALAPWVWMWAIALALFAGAKWLTISRFLLSNQKISPRLLLAYCFLWPGMDARAFCTQQPVKYPHFEEWAGAAGKTALGAGLTWVSLHLINNFNPHVVAWIGMIGLVLLLHFGLFHLVSLLWRTCGLNAKPIMRSPITATSLRKFWGERWNTGFSDLMHVGFFRFLVQSVGPRSGWLSIFLISGVLHELVISVPASGGFGAPTLYFLIQGLGVLIEHSPTGRRLGLGSGWRGWCFVALITAAPVGLLFHPPFIRNVILPMLRAFGSVL